MQIIFQVIIDSYKINSKKTFKNKYVQSRVDRNFNGTIKMAKVSL